jgi:hypothetical protein
MKLIFKKVILGNVGFRMLPRVEFDPKTNEVDSFKENTINLSRTGQNPSCFFSLANFEAHDDHAPGWHMDGSAPADSSALGMTSEQYVNRIVEDLKAIGADITDMKVVEEHLTIPMFDDMPPSHGNGGGNPDDPANGKYGLN